MGPGVPWAYLTQPMRDTSVTSKQVPPSICFSPKFVGVSATCGAPAADRLAEAGAVVRPVRAR